MTCWLFTPGHDARKIARAMSSSAPVVILDWEDAVPAAAKASARETTLQVLDAPPTRPVVVRINAASSGEHAADVAALRELREGRLAGVMVAKTDRPSDLAGLPEGLRIVPLIESAIGLTNCAELCRAHPRVWSLAFGALDYLVDVRGSWTVDAEALRYPRSLLVVASRAAGLAAPIDAVYPYLDDDDGLRRDAALARSLGFGAKLVVHPRQIDVVMAAFAPTAHERERAAAIVAAAALVHEHGVAMVAGMMVDKPVLEWAEGVVASGPVAAPGDLDE